MIFRGFKIRRQINKFKRSYYYISNGVSILKFFETQEEAKLFISTYL